MSQQLYETVNREQEYEHINIDFRRERNGQERINAQPRPKKNAVDSNNQQAPAVPF